MELPITPTFFKNIDIFQKLRSYEKDVDDKPIWQAEKVVLLWASSSNHQHIGSYIEPNNVEGYLEEEVGKKLGEKSAGYAVHIQEVLDALVVRGFAEKNPNNKSIRINADGFVAGKILKETNFLKNNFKYQLWICIWWLVFIIAILVLVTQLISSLISIVKPVQSQMQKSTDVPIFSAPNITPTDIEPIPDGKGSL